MKANTAAPFDLTFNVKASAAGAFTTFQFGSIHTLTISAGSTYSDSVKATRIPALLLFPYSVEVDSPENITLPSGHSGYSITNSDDQPFELIPGGFGAPSQTSNADSQLPKTTELLPNFPNPFNPETWIPYQLAAPADVSISIYSADGAVVRTLALGHQSSGLYQSRTRAAYWDGKNEFGESVSSGVYFYTLTAGDFTATRKMLILK